MPIDYNKLIKEELGDTLEQHIKQNPPYLPRHPFRMVISGPSGCGKTTLVLDLLMDDVLGLNYHTLSVFAKDIEEDKYRWLASRLEEVMEEGRFLMSNKLEDLPDIDSLDTTQMHLFVFDDMVNNKNQEKIKEFFMRGRKKNVSMIYLTQKYHTVPIFIRENANYTIIFKPPNARILSCLYQDCGSDCSTIGDFRRMVDKATQMDHAYLVVDNNQKHKNLKYRCGFLTPSMWEE